jgi:hypothetical protein
MQKYVFRADEPIRIKGANKANPQVIGAALEKISEDNKGELTPLAVVEKARAKSHPLHLHFEWDDSVAAEAYRLDQARSLIRLVRVEDDDAAEGTSRAFISINDGDGSSYRPIASVKRSADLQLAVLKQAQRDLEAWERRYRELTDICQIVRTAREKVQKRVTKSESRVAA